MEDIAMLIDESKPAIEISLPIDWKTKEQNILSVIGILMITKSVHFLGITHDHLIAMLEKIDVTENDGLKALACLIDENLVINRLSQEGTAGPMAHRYRLNPETIKITISLVKKAEK